MTRTNELNTAISSKPFNSTHNNYEINISSLPPNCKMLMGLIGANYSCFIGSDGSIWRDKVKVGAIPLLRSKTVEIGFEDGLAVFTGDQTVCVALPSKVSFSPCLLFLGNNIDVLTKLKLGTLGFQSIYFHVF